MVMKMGISISLLLFAFCSLPAQSTNEAHLLSLGLQISYGSTYPMQTFLINKSFIGAQVTNADYYSPYNAPAHYVALPITWHLSPRWMIRTGFELGSMKVVARASGYNGSPAGGRTDRIGIMGIPLEAGWRQPLGKRGYHISLWLGGQKSFYQMEKYSSVPLIPGITTDRETITIWESHSDRPGIILKGGLNLDIPVHSGSTLAFGIDFQNHAFNSYMGNGAFHRLPFFAPPDAPFVHPDHLVSQTSREVFPHQVLFSVRYDLPLLHKK